MRAAGWTSGNQAGSTINRKLEDYRGELPAVAAVTIPGVDG